MNAATEFDVGPLTWVKSEIDLALERADQSLQQYTASTAEGAGDLTKIKFCRTHLHQVQGALTIVGLDGVTQFTESVEALIEAAEQGKQPANEGFVALAQRALLAIRHYLDDLIVGQPNQPLRLLPLYREVQTARGQERCSATDLFFPDLTARPPRRATAIQPIGRAEFQQLLRQERARFQRGLLAWLRAPQDRDGLGEMLGAVKRIEATQDVASARSFWWVATGFLSALTEGALLPETDVKRLCARIDLQIRRLLEGSRNVAERLMRDALYFVANADSGNDAVRQVKEAYQLHATIPSAEIAAPAPQDTARRRLREIIASTEEDWNRFCAGTAQALPSFKEHAIALSATVEQLGHTDYRRLAQAIAAAANWLAEQPARHSETLAMEIATAILLTQNAQENFHLLGNDFAHQVDVMVARIHGCIAETPPLPGSEVPALDEMSRQAQEKLLIGQVAKEIQTNLAQIEQVLDGFFRDADKRTDLASLEVPLRQVIGALTMLRHDGAVAALRQCAASIRNFTAPDYTPLEDDFVHVADQLSIIGFFIDSLQHGTEDYETFLRNMQAGPTGESDDGDLDETSPGTVEQEVELQKRETHTLLEALREQPDDAGLREEIRQNLTSLQKDADLVADKELELHTRSMLSALETGGENAPALDQVIASLKPQSAETPQPSAATVRLSQSSNEEIDAELLAIFLEEANEVLAAIAENLQLLQAQPHNVEVLTNLRRALHTLKGSGRMVGLKDLGEVAWSIEQVLNLWLRQELEVGPPIFDLLNQSHELFSTWVRHLEQDSGLAPDASKLCALAESLKHGSEELQEASLPGVAPAPAGGIPAAETPRHSAEIITLETHPLLQTPACDEIPCTGSSAEIVDFDFELPPEIPPQGETTVDLLSAPAAEAVDQSLLEPLAFSDTTEEAIELEALPEPMDGTFDDSDMDFDIPLPGSDAEAVSAPAAEVPHEREMAAGNEPALVPEIQDIPAPTPASPALYEIFIDEARTHLTTLRNEFSILETDIDTPTPHEMYRAAHTLGGIAATVGIAPVNRLGLALEHALLRRNNVVRPGSLEALEIIRQTIAELERMLSVIAEKGEAQAAPHLIDALDSLFPAPIVAVAEEQAAPPDAMASAGQEPSAPTAAFALEIPKLQDELDEQLLPIFLEEALDLCQNITAQLRAWRDAPESHEIPRTLARLLHTLKGSARMAGAMNLGAITHAIETRVEELQHAEHAPHEQIDEIESTFDAIVQIVDRLQHGESLDLPEAEESALPAMTTRNEPATDRRHERRQLPEDEPEAAAQHVTLRVRADLIDRLVNEAGELSIARARIEGEMRGLKESLLDLTENVIRLRRQLREVEIQAESQMQSRTAQADERHAGFDPLEFDRFTRFQELTRMMAESVNDVATVQQSLLKNLDDANAAILAQARLNREVQQELMSVRMVPFGSVSDRLYRIVRQTAKELGKRANLEIRGSQVEVDRSVLDKMAAPLEHLLRNAVAHGLEDRDERIARGKPEIGEISLMLAQEGNEIILSFSDDGGGLDFARIRDRGLAAGLIHAEEAADNTRLADLIFTPGFSTAEDVSQIAGRGIGMDVVKTEVTGLGGRIEVLSTPGQGTTFELYIPLTLAVTQAVLVRTGSKRFVIPSVMIEQVLDLKEAPLARIREAGAAEWMGNHYPFNYLPHLLGETQALPEVRRQYWVLLLRSGNQRIAVQVDELRGNQEIVVKNIGPQLARVVGIAGATVLGDGQVVLILNPVALASHTPAINFATPVPTAPMPVADSAAVPPTVMVVDDSLTVRKITGRLLAREGYQVLLAKDGVEGLEQMLDVVPDVLLVDIEMPRMDGFDFTRNVRADARLKDIPIIMITSRTADKHRNYAFEIGVNDYLGKPYQEEELLGLIAGYVKQQRHT